MSVAGVVAETQAQRKSAAAGATAERQQHKQLGQRMQCVHIAAVWLGRTEAVRRKSLHVLLVARRTRTAVVVLYMKQGFYQQCV